MAAVIVISDMPNSESTRQAIPVWCNSLLLMYKGRQSCISNRNGAMLSWDGVDATPDTMFLFMTDLSESGMSPSFPPSASPKILLKRLSICGSLPHRSYEGSKLGTPERLISGDTCGVIAVVLWMQTSDADTEGCATINLNIRGNGAI